jgi:hypothetical protein
MVKPLPLLAVVALELTQIRAEMAAAEYDDKQRHIQEVKFNLGLPLDPIARRRCVAVFTQQRLHAGERIINAIIANGGTVPD